MKAEEEVDLQVGGGESEMRRISEAAKEALVRDDLFETIYRESGTSLTKESFRDLTERVAQGHIPHGPDYRAFQRN